MGVTIEVEDLRRGVSSDVDHSAACLARFAQQRHLPDLSDVTLHVGEADYPAHKFILASVSDVFKVMLTGEMWAAGDKGVIMLNESNECYDVFDDFLQYIYTGQILLRCSNVGGLLILADKYNIAGLVEACCSYMVNHLDQPEDELMVVTWLGIAQLCNRPSLERSCLTYIKLNMDHVMTARDEWNALPFSTLMSLLECSDIILYSEEYLLEQVIEWCEYDADQRLKLLPRLLENIRFALLLPEQLRDLEKSSKYAKYEELLVPYVHMAYRHFALSMRDETEHNCSGGHARNFEYRNYTDEKYAIKLEFSLESFKSLQHNAVEQASIAEPLSFPCLSRTEETTVNACLYPRGLEGDNINIRHMVLRIPVDGDEEYGVSLAVYAYEADIDGDYYLARQTTGTISALNYLLIDQTALQVILGPDSPYLTTDGQLDCVVFIRPLKTCQTVAKSS